MTAWTDIATTSVDLDSPVIESLMQAIRGNLLHLKESQTFGNGRLTKNGANIQLDRFNGPRLMIDGEIEEIPSGGVTLAATGLTIDTDHFIYAYLNVGVMTLEASTTGHATDTTTGIEIKSGDSTRTLVGMARPVTGPVWVDTGDQRFVISYWNRRPIACVDIYTASRSTTSGSWVELNSEIRNEFLTWADEAIDALFLGALRNSSSGNNRNAIGIDDTTPEDGYTTTYTTTTAVDIPVAAATRQALAEGYHYTTHLAHVSAGTGTWLGAASSPERCSLQTIIQG